MFGIDFSEIVVIFVIALVVLGPERLPKLAATIGRWLGRARLMARQFREQLEHEASRLNDGVDLNAQRSSQSSSSTSSASQAASPFATVASSSTAEPAGPAESAPAQPQAQSHPQGPIEGAETAAAGAYQGAAEEFGLHNAGAPEPVSGHSSGAFNGEAAASHASRAEGHAGAAEPGAPSHEPPLTVEAHER